MSDDQLFAVRDPESGELGYCSFLGAGGEVFALTVYPGIDGLRGFRRIAEVGTGPGSWDMRLYLRCLKAEFENRGALQPEDLGILKDLGVKPRGSKAWPMFRSLEPRLLPWFLSEAQVRFLAVMTEQAIDICTRAKRDPALLVSFDESRVLTRQGDSLAGWRDVWTPVPDEGERPLEELPLDPFELTQADALTSTRRGAWEIDIGCAPFPVQERKADRPYYPAAIMVVERKSGVILGLDLENAPDPRPGLRRHMLSIARKLGFAPRTLVTCNPDILVAVKPLADRLGIELKMEPRVPAIEEAFATLENELAGDFQG